ncbi:hypothetical protein CfE428DRAFT_5977 [Chthoniobacter flavus Ellin428]|uniref:Uncharacterized protein n=1 Tax=Chthoniobacter flavus Ellin428 TaxID=497964 RepID=B4DAN6_9BACT|nr:hypothetical protein CfE428DRAFT_5977 [Chthoniobacter flavus Ellin428]TCO82458.1 hypothetical protein EV701_1476 [Chthoniobacter flavus]
MIVVRYIFGTLWCLFVWIFTAVLVEFAIALIFPPSGSRAFVGIGPDWQSIPGTILGLFAAIQSWRTHVRPPAKTPPLIPPSETADS